MKKELDLLIQVCVRHNIHPGVVFVLAYEYAENIKHKQLIGRIYKKYEETKELPVVVANFCLDVLAERAFIPDVLKRRIK